MEDGVSQFLNSAVYVVCPAFKILLALTKSSNHHDYDHDHDHVHHQNHHDLTPQEVLAHSFRRTFQASKLETQSKSYLQTRAVSEGL